MSKIKYVEHTFNFKTLALIEQANSIISDAPTLSERSAFL